MWDKMQHTHLIEHHQKVGLTIWVKLGMEEQRIPSISRSVKRNLISRVVKQLLLTPLNKNGMQRAAMFTPPFLTGLCLTRTAALT